MNYIDNLYTRNIVITLIMFFIFQGIQVDGFAQQNTLDDKKVFLYYVKVHHLNNNDDMFLKYLRLFKNDEFNLYRNDEFNYSKFYNKNKSEYLVELNNLDFNSKYSVSKNIKLGEYNFANKSFPLDNVYFNYFGDLNHIYSPTWPLKLVRVVVFNSLQLNMKL